LDSLVGTLMSLPLEAQAIGAMALIIVVTAIARLFRPRSSPDRDVAASETSPVIVASPPAEPEPRVSPAPPEPPSPPAPRPAPEHRPLEQIDLLSPSQDTPVPVARVDRGRLADAQRRIQIVVARTGGPGPTDNLTAINGLSPSHARTLHRVGLRSFAQLGQLEHEDLEAVSVLLACPVEQITSDDWVGQARRHA